MIRWRRPTILFTHEVFDVFPRNSEDIHIGLHRSQADQAFGEELPCAQFQILSAQGGHALENALTFPDMGSFIGPNEIGNMEEQGVMPLASGVDQAIDGFEHADLAKQVDFCHGKRRIHRAAAGRPRQPISQLERIVTGSLQRSMPDLGMARFVPGDSSKVATRPGNP